LLVRTAGVHALEPWQGFGQQRLQGAEIHGRDGSVPSHCSAQGVEEAAEGLADVWGLIPAGGVVLRHRSLELAAQLGECVRGGARNVSGVGQSDDTEHGGRSEERYSPHPACANRFSGKAPVEIGISCK